MAAQGAEPAAATPLLEVRGLQLEVVAGSTRRTLVAGVDLWLEQGETIAIVGESGSGKSLSARAIVGLLPTGVFPSAGQILFEGRDMLQEGPREVARLRGSSISMIFQDPFTMLNPLLRCSKHIEEVLAIREDAPIRNRSEARREAIARLAEVGITDETAADRYPFQLSGGMRQRVGLAAALAGDPRVLIADEPSTALDVTTQAEILDLLKDVQRARGMGLILITHDLRIAFAVAHRVYVLYAGSLVEVSPADALEREPLHPYSLGLLLSEPAADRRLERLVAIDGAVPGPDEVAEQCSFASRCTWTADACLAGKPPLSVVEGQRETACVRLEEIRHEMAATHAAAKRPLSRRRSRAADARRAADPVGEPDRQGLRRPRGQRGARVARRLDRGRAKRERRARRRVRLRQDDARTLHRRPRDADLGRDRRERDQRPGLPEADDGAAPRDQAHGADRLPGSLLVARPHRDGRCVAP